MLTRKDIIKKNEFLWEIPKLFRADMRVPARIYADEKLLGNIFEDQTLEQLVNSATLPGIERYAMVMPDAHEGYGVPIGFVGGIRTSDGVISPGAIGYDINCLTGDTKILSGFGYYREIKDFQKTWHREDIQSIEFNLQETVKAPVARFFKIKPKTKVFKIVTKSGGKIIATDDHPIFTSSGMVTVRELGVGKKVGIYPFEGVPYKRPQSRIILSEKDIEKTLFKLGRNAGETGFEQNLRVLKRRGLLPLTYDNTKLPYLLKIMGFVFGDGSMNFIGSRGDGIIHFAGKPEDLERIRQDLEALGYTPSKIYERESRLLYRGHRKKYVNHYFYVNASSLVILLNALGVPIGRKVFQEYRLPDWIFRATLWQKRLFLAAFFGAELRTPHPRKKKRTMFDCPVLTMHKADHLISNGRAFLGDVSKILGEFGVKTIYITQRKEHINKKGEISWGLDLVFSSEIQSLINLWLKIGFEYNKKRQRIANIAGQYLKFKNKIIEEKQETIETKIPDLLKIGLSYNEIAQQLASGNPLTERFIVDMCWKLKNKKDIQYFKIPPSFPSFGEFVRRNSFDAGAGVILWDEIVEKKQMTHKGFVYDFTVAHPDHNFIANNFVVSNCGVRVLRSDITFGELQTRLADLMNQIQRDVPSGVGRGGLVKLNQESMKKVLERGVKYIVEKGYGEPEDIEHCEERGVMAGADALAVTEKAKNRGRDQLGTLGSGNHFLEIQKVDEIFNEDIAKIFGLFKDQVTVMIHSGSRGLGHQVCADYVSIMHRVLSKYKIKLSDPELACVPFNSSEGQRYFAAMAASANFAWANRQLIMHLIRCAWQRILGQEGKKLKLIYDVAHNIAKIEQYDNQKLCVHRKGATRAFPPQSKEIPEEYRQVGQPVLIPGTMGTASYIMVGTETAKETFYSVCHGAGRTMSRHAALRAIRGNELCKKLESEGIIICALSNKRLAEEAPLAYKDIHNVVKVVVRANLAKLVARLKPIGVIKG
ncbi:RNA-splicing ligase RtcB [Candidatus Shapirobacteria bacterium]|nr:RNA-splicing ligase RtcB [Candidatus Shapirobacteria bacterium]